MAEPTKCGDVAHTYQNYCNDPVKAEITINSVESKGGCKGVSIKIYDDEGGDPDLYYKSKFPAGPDLYPVPKKGKIEICCGELLEENQKGTCEINATVRWL
ncbi:MAG: hypothetical protein WB764_16990 [Xanthobacteraceae bacterium]